MEVFKRYVADENGSSAVEYGLLAAMIACFVLSALQKIGLNINNKFNVVRNALS